ncbi:style cell-cycle inhibitor 1-A isoform X2 [Punica granatum]|uniref:Style cell-cycle inhibitor 1-A isoform X2 n=1 Tax=Punica granatum TaxID=22663 RepID=A0A6P8CAB8_PUNGR|nr:style cell-cycle inhibitor 1-A isoform X2 [Punica granatum]
MCCLDEGRSKRHRTAEDEEGKKSTESDRKEKRHKHRSDKEKKKKDKHKSEHHKRHRHSKHDFQEISSEDYFLKNNEFAAWLKEEKDVFFSDLSSGSSRALFEDFVKAWNSQDLETRYYEGIASGPRTAHNWKIKK